MTGLVGVNQGDGPRRGPRPAPRPPGARADGAGARGRGRAGRADRAPVRALRRRPPPRRRPRRARRARCARSACSTSPTGASTAFSKGMRQRTKVAAALVCDPQVLVLDEPLNGADPVQRVHLIALFKRLGAEGRTVIVSSHVLNEVERLAERVIVLMHGRLAAAGGHRAIRDAMDDRPRHVLVRSDDGRRLAAVAGRPRFRRRRHVRHDARRAGHPDRCRRGSWRRALPRLARDASIRLLEVRAARRLAREPVPGARPMTASPRRPTGTRRGRGSSPSSATRCSRASRRSGGRRSCCRAPARCCSVCSPTPSTSDRRARLRQRRRRGRSSGWSMPIAALVIGDSVLGAEVRAGTFHFTWLSPTPTWQIVLGRWIGGSIVALVTIAPACRARRGGRRRAVERRAGVHRRGGRQRRRTSPCSSPSAASPGAPRCGRWRSCSSIERLLGAALTGIAQLSPTWESRAIFVGLLDDPPEPPRSATASRRAATPSCASLIVTVVALVARQLADAPPAPLRRRRLNASR